MKKEQANKVKEQQLFSEIDRIYDSLYSDKLKNHGNNRPIVEILADDDFLRNDKAIQLNPDNVKIYLSMIVIPEAIKPYLKNQTRRLSSKLIYECLYKYSHK